MSEYTITEFYIGKPGEKKLRHSEAEFPTEIREDLLTVWKNAGYEVETVTERYSISEWTADETTTQFDGRGTE